MCTFKSLNKLLKEKRLLPATENQRACILVDNSERGMCYKWKSAFVRSLIRQLAALENNQDTKKKPHLTPKSYEMPFQHVFPESAG